MTLSILMIGWQGQVARALYRESEAQGLNIRALRRPDLDLSFPEDAAGTLRGAIRLRHYDVIINCAAYTAVDQAEEEETLASRVNGDGPAALAAVAGDYGIPFLHLSTDYVFDGSKEGPYTEEDPVAPVNAYGRSKLAGEQKIMAANPSALIFRTAWVYSEDGQNFLKSMLRLAESRHRLGIVDDQRGRPTYAGDIAMALLEIAQHIVVKQDMKAHLPSGIYHLSASGDASWYDFAIAIFEESAARGKAVPEVQPIPSEAYPTPAARPANSVLDGTKLAQEFGLVLPDWRNALSRCMTRLAAEGEQV